MKGKVSNLLICMIMAAFLVACGNNQADVPVTDSQVQEESTSESSLQESSETSSDESQVAASSAPSSPEEESEESAESSVEESTEAALESTETKPEEPTKEPESVEPSREQEKTSEAVTPSQEEVKPSAEQTTPSQEAVKPSVEQSTPGQETKPSVSTPSVEQTQPSQEQSMPSEPAVHTCSFDGGSVTTEPTCKAEGVKTYSCSCGKTKTESIPTTNHNYVSESQAATCSAEGFERTKCSNCGDVKSETILGKTDHDYYEFWWHEPTCVSEGYMHLMKCHNCDYQHDLPLGALGHLADAGTVLHPGTCTDRSYITHVCTRCGSDMETTRGSIDPNNHDWWFWEDEQIWCCANGCGSSK